MIVPNFSAKVVMRICYKREWNAHAERTWNINLAKLKQYYFHAEFLEEIQYQEYNIMYIIASQSIDIIECMLCV